MFGEGVEILSVGQCVKLMRRKMAGGITTESSRLLLAQYMRAHTYYPRFCLARPPYLFPTSRYYLHSRGIIRLFIFLSCHIMESYLFPFRGQIEDLQSRICKTDGRTESRISFRILKSNVSDISIGAIDRLKAA